MTSNSAPLVSTYWRKDLLLIALVAVALNGLIALGIGQQNQEYFVDYRLNANPDAVHYVRLGQNLWSMGVYSRMKEPPYQLDVMRTPVYPVLAGALTLGGSAAWPLYLFQFLCSVGTSWLIYAITRQCLSVLRPSEPESRGANWPALAAGMFGALDVSLSVLNFEAMSEPLFALLSTAAVFLWLRGMFGQQATGQRITTSLTLGIVLALAILTRPAALYLPVVFGAVQLVRGLSVRSRHQVLTAIVTAAVAYAAIIPWIVRNSQTFGIARLTTADTINLVYFAGAGAYQVEHGITREEAQERISAEYGLVSLVQANNYWLTDQPVKEMDDEQRRAVPAILSKYPQSLVISTCLGISKAALSHNVVGLAALRHEEWHAPGFATLFQQGPAAFAQRASVNSPTLLIAFAWSIALTLIAYLLAGTGIVLGIRGAATRGMTFSLLAVIGYYALTIGVVGLDAYMRHRSMVLPLVFTFAGLGLRRLTRASVVA